MTKKLSPAQQQYADLKEQHKDCLLFFRLWDFYEVFYEDAHICHKVLSITLTARNKNAPNPIPMAWIPYHALEKYIPKLIENWYKIALAEQIWLPEKWKIVERQVTQIITPSTYVWNNVAENILVWVCHKKSSQGNDYHIAWWDMTLWTYKTFSFETCDSLVEYLRWLQPREIVIDRDFLDKDKLLEYITTSLDGDIPISYVDVPHDVDAYLLHHLRVGTLVWYWNALMWWRARAFSLLIEYFLHTQKVELRTIHSLSYASVDKSVKLDTITQKNLELFSSSYEWSKKYSLFWVLDVSKTPQWRRLFKHRLGTPTSNEQTLVWRLDAIEYFINHNACAQRIIAQLKDVWDLARLIHLILYKKQSALRVQNFAQQIIALCEDQDVLWAIVRHNHLSEEDLNVMKNISEYLSSMLVMENISDFEWYILSWVDDRLDELRSITYHSDDLLLKYQQELVSGSWVSNIKVKYIKNQWYSLEVTPKDIDAFELMIDPTDKKNDFIRTQSLKWWQRYTSTYLSELQKKIYESRQKLTEREEAILWNIISEIQKYIEVIYAFVDAIAFIDVVVSFSDFSQKRWYVRPLYSQKKEIEIRDWKHPVVEFFLDKSTDFVPNDVTFFSSDLCHIITWPNMWWKSTYLRQNAIILLMAHVWLYVPASYARVMLVDWIFARVWSWDALAKNQSTFMTEMLEMSYILHHATDRSFVVLDELWRWTSTSDWLSLARSIVVYMCRNLKSKILFATHYHELLQLENELPWCSNWSLRVYENDDEIVFMKKIIRWWISKSYGLDVAQLAWIPAEVLTMAKDQLLLFQGNKKQKSWEEYPMQVWFWWSHSQDMRDSERVCKSCESNAVLVKRLRELDISRMSPLDVMNWVNSMKTEFWDEGDS